MSGLAVGSRFGSGNPTKDDDIQEAVAHEAVLTVNTADVFSGSIEAGILVSLFAPMQIAAILIMEGRIH